MARRTIFCRNVRQNTARIDRTVGNTAISRTFVRSVLSQDIDRQWTVTERHGKYRPLIDRAEICCLAGLFPE